MVVGVDFEFLVRGRRELPGALYTAPESVATLWAAAQKRAGGVRRTKRF